MRPFSKLLALSLIVSTPALIFACDGGSRDDDGMGGSGGGNTGGGNTGGGNTGGGNTGGGNTGGGNTGGGNTGGTAGEGGMGGGSGGGSGGTVEPPARFTVADCAADGGPNAAVTAYSLQGAFTEDAEWLEGWTNFSTNSTPEDGGGAADGAIEDCDTGTCSYAAGIYTLEGNVYVADGATIEFEPGTIIRGAASPQGTLIISRGGRIEAVGTADDPIIFTSAAANGDKEMGGWGGLVILGNAVNFQGDEFQIEGLPADAENQHGGTDDEDDSGILNYVRVEFGGIDLGGGNEINGISLGSVGSGTEISHVQVNTTLDDGFEWFGGTVNADHLVVNNAGDDLFDADDGYRGTVSFGFGRHLVPVTADPNGFEIDGNSDAAPPADEFDVNTEGEFENFTLCADVDNDGIATLTYGGTFRRNYAGSVDSAVLVGFDYGFDLRDDVQLEMTNTHAFDNFSGIANAAETDNDGGVDEAEWFADQDGNVDFDE